jgi:aryl-alcohol dehydrogenase-like predicted oxidoreductase
LGVIVKEAMANGRLGPRGDDAARTILEPIAHAHGVHLDAVAIAAALANPWADVVLSGAVTPEQLRSNAAALHLALDEVRVAELASLAEPPAAYWRTRSRLAWT